MEKEKEREERGNESGKGCHCLAQPAVEWDGLLRSSRNERRAKEAGLPTYVKGREDTRCTVVVLPDETHRRHPEVGSARRVTELKKEIQCECQTEIPWLASHRV